LKTEQPKSEQILHAVMDVLNKPHFKESVSRLSKEFQFTDAIGKTINYLIQMATSN
jgi:UDP:flavonoid glycosyltransferase YjiC (YdhE family)